MRREIDPQSSPRGRAFELWKNATMPKVTITKTFNIGIWPTFHSVSSFLGLFMPYYHFF